VRFKVRKENERLLNMLRENKITDADYKILSAALDKKSSLISSVFSLIVNPFQKIAGLYALLIGIGVIISMSYLGVIAKVYFPGPISCLNSILIKNPKMQISFFLLLYQNIISWVVLTTLFIIAAKFFRQKRIRIIDFFGTVALSRIPYLVVVAIVSIIQVLNPSFMNIDIAKGIPIHLSFTMSVFSIVLILCAIWQITTYFYALKESSGLVGKKLWVSFIVAIILGEVISSPLSMIFL